MKFRTHPGRSLLTTVDGVKVTATWERHPEHGWKCVSAGWRLKWMRGMTNTQTAIKRLATVKWEWLPSNTVKPVTPPFTASPP